MDQIVLTTIKASNHINLRKDLIKIGINKDLAASIAHIYLFKLAQEQKYKLIQLLTKY